MISGRGLGATGGTLDKLESIPGFNVNLTLLDFFVRWGLVADPDGTIRAGLDQGPD